MGCSSSLRRPSRTAGSWVYDPGYERSAATRSASRNVSRRTASWRRCRCFRDDAQTMTRVHGLSSDRYAPVPSHERGSFTPPLVATRGSEHRLRCYPWSSLVPRLSPAGRLTARLRKRLRCSFERTGDSLERALPDRSPCTGVESPISIVSSATRATLARDPRTP